MASCRLWGCSSTLPTAAASVATNRRREAASVSRASWTATVTRLANPHEVEQRGTPELLQRPEGATQCPHHHSARPCRRERSWQMATSP